MSSWTRREIAFDPLLVGGSLALAVLGALMVGSASISLADNSTGDPFFYLFRHLGALGIGAVALAVAAAVPMELWYRLNGLLLFAALALLASALVPGIGHTVNGSARWISVGPITLQPSEPARLCMLMYIASYCVRRHADLTAGLVAFVKPLLLVGLAGMLLLAEPDFGALVVLTAASLGVLFVAGARLRDVALAFLVAAAGFAVLSFSASYRLERLTAFLDPWADPYASGFQLTQSLIAIGRGDWLGVGLGESVQKMFYLPEAHTDFVFAVLAEELGFVGSTAVIALFGLVVFRSIAIGRRAIAAGLPFHGLVATGIGLTIGFQAFINIGVNTGLLPTKGLTLPLLSYGRSSTIVTLAALGLLLRVYHELVPAERRRAAAGRES
jgi:cell division protein FtsW